jgi:hypothetical protein
LVVKALSNGDVGLNSTTFSIALKFSRAFLIALAISLSLASKYYATKLIIILFDFNQF